MKRLLIAAALVLSASTPARADQFLALGAGGDPCSDWLDGRDTNVVIGNWALGFWSGLNAMSTKDQTVGYASKGKLLAELMADCHVNPDVPVSTVLQRLYFRYQAQGR